MAYKTLKDLVGFKKIDWEKSEERANELYEFTQDGLDLSQWEVTMPYYGRMSFNEFIDKAKKEIHTGRYIEVTEALFFLLADMQNHFDIVKTRFNDVFRSLLNTLEEKKMTIDAVEEQLQESDGIVERYKLENEELKEENNKLRTIIEFSNSGYFELWKIIEVKMDNLLHIYNNIQNVETKEELLSYIEAIKVEINVGVKPIQAKKNFLIKQQLENLGYSFDDIGKPKQEVQEKPKQEVQEKPKKENPIKPNVDKFKEELNKLKPKQEDYEISDEELSQNKMNKYIKFKIHDDPELYDEDKWSEESEDGQIGIEEKEIRRNLIRDKLPEDELYILESEIDYNDNSMENIARAFTLIQMEQELNHMHFGVNSVKWKKKFEQLYPDCVDRIKSKNFKGLNPTYFAMFKKFNFKWKD